MPGPQWTDAERWKLLRAAARYADEYGTPQWRLILMCEEFQPRNANNCSQTYRRLVASGWRPPEGTARLPLRVEEDPDAVIAEIAAFIRENPATRSKMPPNIRGGDAPPPEPSPDDPHILRLERDLQAARDENRKLKAKLRAAHRDTTALEYAAEVVRQTTAPIEPAPVPALLHRPETTPVDAVALLSDEHADEELSPSASWGIEDFGFGPFRVRLQRWTEVVIGYLTDHLPRHAFERLWIFKLGDSINGDIHGLGDKGSFANTLKAALAVGDAEAQAIQLIARETGVPIHVVSVPGNHPRRSRKKDYTSPHDNFDYLVTAQIAARLAEQPNVEVVAPEAWTAFVDVRGHLFALNHGDDIRGTWGIPWYGVDRRANRIQAVAARFGERHVRYFVYGHWHRTARVPAAGADVRFNGAFPATSQYAIDGLALATEPSQSLFVVSSKRGIILSVDILVRDRDRERAFRAGQWEPEIGRQTVLDELEPVSARTPVGTLQIVRAKPDA